uniref:Uncharacterized protein n=1 Tax=Prolemur simus TaxID=1328070 RepID=A0A8C9AN02_PROSS
MPTKWPLRRYRKANFKNVKPLQTAFPKRPSVLPLLVQMRFLLKVNLTQVASKLGTPFISDM